MTEHVVELMAKPPDLVIVPVGQCRDLVLAHPRRHMVAGVPRDESGHDRTEPLCGIRGSVEVGVHGVGERTLVTDASNFEENRLFRGEMHIERGRAQAHAG
jgi:hypothetical protein